MNKLVPQTFHSAQIVYMIYIGMTAVQIVLMLLGGVTPFEAVTLTFGTAGTGGFAVRNDGLVSLLALHSMGRHHFYGAVRRELRHLLPAAAALR